MPFELARALRILSAVRLLIKFHSLRVPASCRPRNMIPKNCFASLRRALSAIGLLAFVKVWVASSSLHGVSTRNGVEYPQICDITAHQPVLRQTFGADVAEHRVLPNARSQRRFEREAGGKNGRCAGRLVYAQYGHENINGVKVPLWEDHVQPGFYR